MREIAEVLILAQSIAVSIAIIAFALYVIIKYSVNHYRFFEWLVDYMMHRYKFQKYLEEEKKNERD